MKANTQVRDAFSPFYLDTVNQCAWLDERQVSLSPKAFSVLHYLAERQGCLVTKQELLDRIWPNVFVTEGVLKRAILEVRKALSDSAVEPRFIQTCHRRGYRFLSQSAAATRPVVPTAISIPVSSRKRSRFEARLRRNSRCLCYRRRLRQLRSYGRVTPVLGASILRMGELR